MTEEELLSPELRDILGDADNLILPSRKKAKKEIKVVKIPEEVVKETMLQSKKRTKKLEQLRVKKAKEDKRNVVLECLKQHEITETNRNLMLSTRDIGQTLSTKKRLKLIIGKQRAGLQLTHDEETLLFRPMNLSNSTDEISNNEILRINHNNAYEQRSSVGEESILLRNRDDNLDTLILPVTTPFTSPNEASSLINFSTKFLEKFGKLKDTGFKTSSSVSTDEFGERLSSDVTAKTYPSTPGSVITTPSQRATEGVRPGSEYIAHELPAPVSEQGRILRHNNEPSSHQFVDSCQSGGREQITRNPDIQAARMALPVCGMEQEIVESVRDNDVTILCGETGSGKSTQVPQFLFEAGYARYGVIGVTQPRRVAAVSTAQRVSHELCQSECNGSTPVAYQIRHDRSTVGAATVIKFMTDGILLKEATEDLLLRKYSVILLDEAHERNLNTDVLLGLLSRSLPIRRAQSEVEQRKWERLSEEEKAQYESPMQPLRLVIMSATLRVTDFQNPRLFPSPPPIIRVEARQFPVTVHFSRRTELSNYLKEARNKVVQIHRKLPAGGVLVFLTGRREVLAMCAKLRKTLGGQGSRAQEGSESTSVSGGSSNGKVAEDVPSYQTKLEAELGGEFLGGLDANEEAADAWDGAFARAGDVGDDESDADGDDDDVSSVVDEEEGTQSSRLLKGESPYNQEDAQPGFTLDEAASDSVQHRMLQELLGANSAGNEATQQSGTVQAEDVTTSSGEEVPLKALVLPLFALLSPEQQAVVFRPPPEGHRLIVVATNVAETSITIPGIRYVVDCGRQKEKRIKTGGVASYEIAWISKASAEQRKGRAGVLTPDLVSLCLTTVYRSHWARPLLSTLQHLVEYQSPEIERVPLEDILLQMHSLGIPQAAHFPFPTPPPVLATTRAEALLRNLGAIKEVDRHEDSNTSSVNAKQLTKLGSQLARIPINPRLGKVLVISARTSGLGISSRSAKPTPSHDGLELLNLSIALVAVLSERSPFLHTENSRDEAAQEKDYEEEDSDLSNGEDAYNILEKDSHSEQLLSKHPRGDALARLSALGAYLHTLGSEDMQHKILHNNRKRKRNVEKGGNGVEETCSKSLLSLCRQQGLHLPTLRRMVQLRQQLAERCVIGPLGIDFQDKELVNRITNGPLPLPTASDETALRQILLTGFGDCVARRAPVNWIQSSESCSSSSSNSRLSRRRRLTAYLSCNPLVPGPVYIHPQSALYKQDPAAQLPEYVVYTDLIMNKRGDTTYMACVTPISGSWLSQLLRDCPLLRWSSPLSSPSPSYDANSDEVVCYCVPKFGHHVWELSPVKLPMTDNIVTAPRSDSGSNNAEAEDCEKDNLIFRWFGRLLLEGKVLTELSPAHLGQGVVNNPQKTNIIAQVFKETPVALTQLTPSLHLNLLASSLTNAKVCSKRKLLQVLEQSYRDILTGPRDKILIPATTSSSVYTINVDGQSLVIDANKLFLSTEIQNILRPEIRRNFRKIWCNVLQSHFGQKQIKLKSSASRNKMITSQSS